MKQIVNQEKLPFSKCKYDQKMQWNRKLFYNSDFHSTPIMHNIFNKNWDDQIDFVPSPSHSQSTLFLQLVLPPFPPFTPKMDRNYNFHTPMSGYMLRVTSYPLQILTSWGHAEHQPWVNESLNFLKINIRCV